MMFWATFFACRPSPLPVDLQGHLISPMASAASLGLNHGEPFVVFQEQENYGLQPSWSGPSNLIYWTEEASVIIAGAGSLGEGDQFLASVSNQSVTHRAITNDQMSLWRWSLNSHDLIATGEIRASTNYESSVCWTENDPDEVWCDGVLTLNRADHPHRLGEHLVAHSLDGPVIYWSLEKQNGTLLSSGNRPKLVDRSDGLTQVVAADEGALWVASCEAPCEATDWTFNTLPRLTSGRELAYPEPLYYNNQLLIVAEGIEEGVANLAFGTSCDGSWRWLSTDEEVERELGGRRLAKGSPAALVSDGELFVSWMRREEQSEAWLSRLSWGGLLDQICA